MLSPLLRLETSHAFAVVFAAIDFCVRGRRLRSAQDCVCCECLHCLEVGRVGVVTAGRHEAWEPWLTSALLSGLNFVDDRSVANLAVLEKLRLSLREIFLRAAECTEA